MLKALKAGVSRKGFKGLLAASVAVVGCLAASTSAQAITRLTFTGTISTPPSVQGSPPPFTVPAQTNWFANVAGGATYEYVIDYNPASVGVGQVFPISLVSGRIGSNTESTGYTATVHQYNQFILGNFSNVMDFKLFHDDGGGFSHQVILTIIDYQAGLFTNVNTLPTTITASLEQDNAQFTIGGLNVNQGGGSMTAQILPTGPAPGGPGGVPEPASWALMIGGFGAAGAMLRRKRFATA